MGQSENKSLFFNKAGALLCLLEDSGVLQNDFFHSLWRKGKPLDPQYSSYRAELQQSTSPGGGPLPGGLLPRRTSLPLALFSPAIEITLKSPLLRGELCSFNLTLGDFYKWNRLSFVSPAPLKFYVRI